MKRMDLLTSAADAILTKDLGYEIPKVPAKNYRKVFGNLTNQSIPSPHSGSSINALFQGKISSACCHLKTPGKRKNSRYGDENEAPSPKTPKNSFDLTSSKDKSPISPMSNLRLLTRIASMEEHLPSEKSLGLCSSGKSKTNLRRYHSDNAATKLTSELNLNKPKFKRYSTSMDLGNVCNAPLSVVQNSSFVVSGEGSRREKSLGLLCERFLEHFPIEVSYLETPRRLVIDDVALTLGTERRRVYDIVNILECLNMASRVQKNMYQWMGNQHLEITLARLKALALSWGVGEHTTPIDQSIKEIKSNNGELYDAKDKSEARKDKSLGVLCQKFLMLFLTSSPPHILQLDTILHLLLGKEGEDFDKLRTRGRRIYDIANVLISLKLMKKVPQGKSFMYIGPAVVASKLQEALLSGKQVRLRHSLLPPLNDFMNCPMMHCPETDKNLLVTPSNLIVPIEKKGRPRKLASEFVISAANRNYSRLTHDEDKGEGKVGNEFSLQFKPKCDVQDKSPNAECGIFVSPVNQPVRINLGAAQNLRCTYPSNILRFPRLGSPRMALTFQNPPISSPPSLTNKPPIGKLPHIQVTTRPPFYLQEQTVNCKEMRTLPLKVEEGKKPIYIIHRSLRPVQTGTGFNPNGNGIFKVYSRPGQVGKSVSTPSNFHLTKTTSQLPSVSQNFQMLTSTKNFNKSSSLLNPLPNINLSTLTKNNYKTVLGSHTKIPSFKLSPNTGKGPYHFVINTNKISPIQDTSSSLEKDNRSPSFVKILENSPDNSSTDSELESIFGDSFKFTRPKNLINQNKH